ncbi:predicted protein [Chaetomium globosum CBS 148.51]|uniref:Uncharacterized protein n=1 Tax=Chaetomium globosum (strain ATCC 6205 / CBS 148.51 / DSM 1962 / NBRC 6347 / NRRL 1970) TaxID=306901 RepID=Q2H2T8_CHAGB|nr:uncharacterized protein CHGG_03908 [Chaetomium globosum CBS 148.51]EAQ87289.1 predicted protein [Chaetomium globosum CBS 148.51]
MSNSARAKKPCCPGALTFAAREAATCRSCLVVLETFFRDADTDRAPSIRVRSGQLISSFGHAKVGGLWISEQLTPSTPSLAPQACFAKAASSPPLAESPAKPAQLLCLARTTHTHTHTCVCVCNPVDRLPQVTSAAGGLAAGRERALPKIQPSVVRVKPGARQYRSRKASVASPHPAARRVRMRTQQHGPRHHHTGTTCTGLGPLNHDGKA